MRQTSPFLLLLLATSAMAQPAPGRGSKAERAPAAGQPAWSADSDQRRSELRHALQAQRQADTLVGPQVAEPAPVSDRHLSPQERQELRRQLLQLRQARAQPSEPDKRNKP